MTVVFDIGETLVRDDRYWGSLADWLNVPRHTLSALVGAVTALGMDNAEAVRLLRPGIDLHAVRRAREEADRGEYLDESDVPRLSWSRWSALDEALPVGDVSVRGESGSAGYRASAAPIPDCRGH